MLFTESEEDEPNLQTIYQAVTTINHTFNRPITTKPKHQTNDVIEELKSELEESRNEVKDKQTEIGNLQKAFDDIKNELALERSKSYKLHLRFEKAREVTDMYMHQDYEGAIKQLSEIKRDKTELTLGEFRFEKATAIRNFEPKTDVATKSNIGKELGVARAKLAAKDSEIELLKRAGHLKTANVRVPREVQINTIKMQAKINQLNNENQMLRREVNKLQIKVVQQMFGIPYWKQH